LADVGLDGDEAALDIRDLRSLLDSVRLVRRTAMPPPGYTQSRRRSRNTALRDFVPAGKHDLRAKCVSARCSIW